MSEPHVLDPAAQDVHGEASLLREQGPATRIVLPGNVLAWAVTDQDLLTKVLRHHQVSKNADAHWRAWRDGEIPRPWALDLFVTPQNMLTAHGDDLRRLRSVMMGSLTRQRVAALGPRISAIADRLLDAIAEAPGDQPIDLRAEYADPLPIAVICELFGVPVGSIQHGLREVANQIFATAASPHEAEANGIRMYELLGDLVAHTRRHPADNFTHALIALHDHDPGRLSEQELLDTLVLVIVAGHKTTTDLLDQAITALLSNSNELRRARTGSVAWSEVIEETLRCHPPVSTFPLRFAIEDLMFPEYPGVRIPAGDAILAHYAGAGRDPRVHEDPDRFDPTRTAKDHVSFGDGMHRCIGEPLARLESGIALPALFRRFPDLQLAVPPTALRPVRSFVLNGHELLPVHTGTTPVPSAAS